MNIPILEEKEAYFVMACLFLINRSSAFYDVENVGHVRLITWILLGWLVVATLGIYIMHARVKRRITKLEELEKQMEDDE